MNIREGMSFYFCNKELAKEAADMLIALGGYSSLKEEKIKIYIMKNLGDNPILYKVKEYI